MFYFNVYSVITLKIFYLTLLLSLCLEQLLSYFKDLLHLLVDR